MQRGEINLQDARPASNHPSGHAPRFPGSSQQGVLSECLAAAEDAQGLPLPLGSTHAINVRYRLVHANESINYDIHAHRLGFSRPEEPLPWHQVQLLAVLEDGFGRRRTQPMDCALQSPQ